MTYRQTPAGLEREQLTAAIMSHHNQEHTRDVLILKVGMSAFRSMTKQLADNGGGSPTVRDLCAYLNNIDLAKVARKLRIPAWR